MDNRTELDITKLVERIAELERTNASLRRKLASRSETKRSLLDDINNHEKAVELFSIDHKNGKLYKTKASLYGNFLTFFTNIFRALNPAVATNKATGGENIRHYPVNDTTPEDYEVYRACLEACIDVIYDARKKLQYREPIAPSINDIKEVNNE